ncbi:hypothetical protein SAMN05421693_11422 [Ectothiorhodospira magna]|uniref:Uncharacterized protein n=1 Tax=Ectothiorhodospira magna TaxID=867345 RepID=A0A1H9CJG5_9GAMM|nr:hypothetical protein [Ectothiorhodospira magna]SEQ01366.1 hypothetical protein SAMN05421693_11422 [Ectothiorhodospira magna]
MTDHLHQVLIAVRAAREQLDSMPPVDQEVFAVAMVNALNDVLPRLPRAPLPLIRQDLINAAARIQDRLEGAGHD